MAAVDAVVVGAGVVGLTTAISLAEAGLVTQVIAAQPPSRVTSAAAGAVWGPVRCGPPDRCYAWSRVSLEVFGSLAGEPASGVRQLPGRAVATTAEPPPGWLDLVPGMRLLTPAELPAGSASGWHYTAPVINMPVYLDYLLARYTGLGGTVEWQEVPSLAAVAAPVVVNCTGIGARSLVPDPAVVPVRGQVIVVADPGLEEFYIDQGDHGTDYVYAFPHGDVVVLGGTAEEGATDWPPRPAVSERILRDAAAVFPALRDAPVLAERVGLRPVRPTVRLEPEPLPGGRVLWHNYGHGGGGVTLAWGCAREITGAVLAGTAPA